MANNLIKMISSFASKRKKNKNNSNTEVEIYEGSQISSLGYRLDETITQNHQLESLLTELRNTTDVGEQLEIIAARDPDVSMAVWSFQKLSFQGFNIEITDLNGKRIEEAEALFNEQCKNWNVLSHDGLDGIVENLHKFGLLYNIMILEVVVDSNSENTFKGIYLIDPRTIEWKLESRDGETKWIPYQDQDGTKVDLTKGNIFWVIANQDITSPIGPYLLESAISAVDFKLQTYKDSAAVLRRQGYPYNIWSIDKERAYNTMPQSDKNNPKKFQEYISKLVSSAKTVASTRTPTQDIVITDDIKIERSSSASAGSSIDTRAWSDVVDIQIMNGVKSLGIMLNRSQGVTETWGTVQMKIITDMIESFQRKSKRLIENIGRMWLQLNGIQGNFKMIHNPLDYQDEQQKWEAQIKKDEHFQKAQENGWISPDEAANGAVGVEKAYADMSSSSNNNQNQNDNTNNEGGEE